MSKILVTGGAGFIGSNLVRALLDRGDEVVIIDDLSTGDRRNFLDVAHRGVTFVEASVEDSGSLKNAVAGCKHVVHLAAQVSVPASMTAPDFTHDINATGTQRVFEAARNAGVESVVFASSCAVYGDDPTMPKRESQAPMMLSPYAVSKYIGERYAEMYTKVFGLPVVAMRFFNVFGPRQSPVGGYAAVIPKFVFAMQQGGAPTIFGDGTQTRDFVYVDNVVDALLAASTTEAAAGRAFNIGTGVETSLLDLVAGVNTALGTSIQPTFGAVREGDIHRSVADISAAREVLGYAPKVDLVEGLKATIAWLGRGR